MKLRVCGAGDRGLVRERDEDHYLIGGLVEGSGTIETVVDTAGELMTDYGLLVCVADGMGGYGGGAEASRVALTALTAAFYAHSRRGASHEQLSGDVTAAVAAAAGAVERLQASGPGFEQSGTTLAGVVLLAPDVLVVFHVGDSRVLRWSGGMLRVLTVDHTLVGAQVAAGQLTEEQALASADGGLLTRSVGGPNGEVEIGRQLTWGAEDLFLLGSDGWFGLGRGVAHDAMTGALSGVLKGPELADHLLREALAADGSDNATVVTVAPETEGQRG